MNTAPAFPWEQSPGNQNNLGLTKRELIAAMALQGIITAFGRGLPAPWDYSQDPQGKSTTTGFNYSLCAIGYADALLAELEKR